VADTEPGAGPDRDDAVRDVLTGPATVGAGREFGRQGDAAAFDPHGLLHGHGIGAGCIGAPVKIRTATPEHAAVGVRPAWIRPERGRWVAPPSAQSAARTA